MDKTAQKKALESATCLTDIFPNGATSEQLIHFGWLFCSCQADTRLWDKYADVPASAQRLDIEHDAWSMMESHHAYGGVSQFFDDDTRYNYKSYLEKWLDLGGDKDVFMDSITTQRTFLENTSVVHGVGRDGEGCVYNGIDYGTTPMVTIELPA